MTSPVTGRTPLFQLPYMQQGQPIFEYRQISEDLAKALEAVLASKAVSPPGAADLAAVAGRVSALEADQAAEDALFVRKAVTFQAGWEQHPTAPYAEAVRVWKEAPTVVRLQGMVRATVAVAAGASSNILLLPVGYRPANQVVRQVGFGGAANAAPSMIRSDITSAGMVNGAFATAITVNQFLVFDFSFRTVND